MQSPFVKFCVLLAEQEFRKIKVVAIPEEKMKQTQQWVGEEVPPEWLAAPYERNSLGTGSGSKYQIQTPACIC